MIKKLQTKRTIRSTNKFRNPLLFQSKTIWNFLQTCLFECLIFIFMKAQPLICSLYPHIFFLDIFPKLELL